MTKTMVIVLLLLSLPVVAGAQGTLHNDVIFSESLGFDRSIGIYLPEGYDPTGEDRYPVVYFLHGATYGYSVYWTYFEMRASLDNLIASGQIEPVIMVTPDGLIAPYEGSYWTNSELYGAFEDFVFRDVVAHMDSSYCTIPTRAFRSVQGLSMGGYGAMKQGLKHPETYRALASHSGANDLFVDLENRRPLILGEYESGPPYDFHPDSGSFSALLFSQAGAYSPNMENPPWFVDLPLDSLGDIIPAVMARWLHHNPAHLATLLPPYPWPPESDLDIFFDCGTLDENQLYPGNCALAESLDALGIGHTFQSFVGGHSDRFVQRFRVGVAHLDSVMWGKGPYFSTLEPTTAVDMAFPPMLVSSPNVGYVSLQFDLPTRCDIRLSIYDHAGRLVRRVREGTTSPGRHCVSWSADDSRGAPLPSGVYFARLAVDGARDVTRRVVLVRR